jgi:D-arabinose 1-dehydrogenase-like Zn-dependent alcohol dehydrogenase
VHARLGSGGFGKLFRASTADGRQWTLKVLHPDVLQSLDIDHLRQTIEALRAAHHRVIPTEIDVVTFRGDEVLVTSAGNLTAFGTVTADTVKLDSATGVGASGSAVSTNVTTLSARSSTSGGVFISETGGLTIGNVDGLLGINTSGGNGEIRITATDVNISNTVSAGAGNISLIPAASGDNIGIGAGATGSFALSEADLQNLDTTGDVTIGARALVHPWHGCGDCPVCRSGSENLCLKPRSLGVFSDGGYADYCLVPHPRYLIDIGDLDPAVATPYSCSGVTVFSALKKLLPVDDEEWLVIMGAGGLGLNAVAIAKGMGAANVLSVDIDESKLEAARELGADATLNSTAPDALARLGELTGGAPRAVLDTVGAEATSKLALGALAKAGRYVIVGLYGGSLTLPLVTLPLRAISIAGSYTGNLQELKELIELAKSGKVKALPTQTRDMSRLGDTLDDLRAGRIVGRVVLTNAGR